MIPTYNTFGKKSPHTQPLSYLGKYSFHSLTSIKHHLQVPPPQVKSINHFTHKILLFKIFRLNIVCMSSLYSSREAPPITTHSLEYHTQPSKERNTSIQADEGTISNLLIKQVATTTLIYKRIYTHLIHKDSTTETYKNFHM